MADGSIAMKQTGVPGSGNKKEKLPHFFDIILEDLAGEHFSQALLISSVTISIHGDRDCQDQFNKSMTIVYA